MEADWFAAMRELYRDVDAELNRLGVVCRGCGECCHFDTVDHILYAGELERRFLAANVECSPNPDGSPDLLARGLRCPFQAGGRCLARGGRVLGCRLHFCSWSEHGREQEFAETWYGLLKTLHDELGVKWDFRPLLPWKG